MQECALQFCTGIDNRHSNQDGRKKQDKQENDFVENATIAKESHNPLLLISVPRKTTIRSKLEGVVLVTTEAKELIRVDVLPERDLMHAWKTATDIMDAFLKRLSNLLIIIASKTSIKLLNIKWVATENSLPPQLFTINLMRLRHIHLTRQFMNQSMLSLINRNQQTTENGRARRSHRRCRQPTVNGPAWGGNGIRWPQIAQRSAY